jgi:glc operon protein GlcG
MPVQAYGPSLSLADAKKVLQAAESAATANDWAMSIAITDTAGHLITMQRMDHAQLASVVLAQAKARSAVNFKCPTSTFEKAVAGAGAGLKLLAVEGLCPVEGGIPLVADGKIVGAIGVSGAQSAQDGQVATAAAQVFAGIGTST